MVLTCSVVLSSSVLYTTVATTLSMPAPITARIPSVPPVMAPLAVAVQRNVQFVDAQPSGVFALTVTLAPDSLPAPSYAVMW